MSGLSQVNATATRPRVEFLDSESDCLSSHHQTCQLQTTLQIQQLRAFVRNTARARTFKYTIVNEHEWMDEWINSRNTYWLTSRGMSSVNAKRQSLRLSLSSLATCNLLFAKEQHLTLSVAHFFWLWLLWVYQSVQRHTLNSTKFY